MSRGLRVLRARRAEVARLRAVAAENAACGWYVFPVAAGGKLPIFHHRDRCRGRGICRDGHQGWQERATRDEDQIHQWWTGTTPWNVALACGPSGLLVVDLDLDGSDADDADPGRTHHAGAQHAGPHRNGAAELARLAAAHGAALPPTFSVSTPSGGRHDYYRAPGDLNLTISQGRLGPGIDTRGRGGLVVAAGSVRPGGRYRVTRPGPVADLPRWLGELLVPPPPRPALARARALAGPRASRYLAAVIDIKTAEVRDAQVGSRQWAVKAAARRLGQFVGGGELEERDAYNELYAAARGHIGVEGMDHREVDAAIRDGMRFGMQAPIQLNGPSSGG